MVAHASKFYIRREADHFPRTSSNGIVSTTELFSSSFPYSFWNNGKLIEVKSGGKD